MERRTLRKPIVIVGYLIVAWVLGAVLGSDTIAHIFGWILAGMLCGWALIRMHDAF